MATPGPIEELVATFMTPAKSGVYLAKHELLLLARATEASLRINERKRMLADVLRSAQTQDELAGMLARLGAFCSERIAEYEALAQAYPATAALWRPWVDRARRMRLLLEETQAEVHL